MPKECVVILCPSLLPCLRNAPTSACPRTAWCFFIFAFPATPSSTWPRTAWCFFFSRVFAYHSNKYMPQLRDASSLYLCLPTDRRRALHLIMRLPTAPTSTWPWTEWCCFFFFPVLAYRLNEYIPKNCVVLPLYFHACLPIDVVLFT